MQLTTQNFENLGLFVKLMILMFDLFLPGMRQWTRIRYKQGPPELHNHTAVKVANGMLIYGGESNGVMQGEVWQFHFG